MKKDWLCRCTSCMKKGWIYRTSCDEKNHEIAPMMMTQWWSKSSDDPDPVMMIQQWWSRSSDDVLVMIQIQWWWSRSSDDPDPVMMIQIQWWSRSSDDDLDQVMIQIQMKITWSWIWRWRGLDDDLHDTEKKTCADKLCRENTFLVNRECWCICNFGMYSLVYLMYCTPMFTPRSIYNVIESCHAPMFRSGD